MKNIYTYISVAVVMLVMMVASAFLLTAADAPVRAAGGYVTLIFGAIATWPLPKHCWPSGTTRSAVHPIMRTITLDGSFATTEQLCLTLSSSLHKEKDARKCVFFL